jgi:mediator of RNA polymerase II transcription subunit 17, fungi type
LDDFEPGPETPRCDFIYHALHLLLLRLHLHQKLERLGNAGVVRDIHPIPPQAQQAQKQIGLAVLQPLIDVLQYQVFCDQTIGELDTAVKVLTIAGVNASLKFTPVGETGKELFQLFAENSPKRWGGEAILKIDRKYAVFTSSLVMCDVH